MTTIENARLFASTLTANGALAAGKHTPVDATSGPITVTLPLTATSGAPLSVEKRDASTNAVIVSGSIRGSLTTISLAWQFETLTLRWSGSTWVPTEGHKTKASLDAAYAVKASEALISANQTAIAKNVTALGQLKDSLLAYRRGVATAGGNYSPSNHFYPSQAAVSLYAAHGHTIVRQTVKWEYLQPTLGGPLDATELARLNTSLGYFNAAGIQVILEPHNYGDYTTADGVTHQLNDPDGVVTNARFADFWTKLSTAMLNNPAVYGYELMNEPRHMFGGYTASGSDLIGAGGFESAIPSNISYTNATGVRTSVNKRTGSFSLAITAVAAGDVQVKFTGIPVSTAQNYNYFAYFKAATTNRNVHVGLLGYNSTGAALNSGGEFLNGGYLNDTDWVVIQFQGKPIANTATVDLMFTIRACAAGETHYMDDLTFVPTSTSYTPAQSWEISAQAAVDAIRAVDSVRMLWIPVYEWQSVSRVAVNHPAGPWIVNGGSVRYSAHLYFDYSGGGTYTTTYAADTASAVTDGNTNLQTYVLGRLKVFTDWLTKWGAKGVISEVGWPFGGSDQASWQAIGEAAYDAMDLAQLDVTYWAASEYSNNVLGSNTIAYNGYPGVATPVWPQASVIEAHPSVIGASQGGGGPALNAASFTAYRSTPRRFAGQARASKILLSSSSGTLTGSGSASNKADTTDFVLGTSAARLVTGGAGAFSSYQFPNITWDASASLIRLVFKLDDWTNLSYAALDMQSGGTWANYFQVLLTAEGQTGNSTRIIRSGEWLTIDFPRDAFTVKAGTPNWATLTACRIEAVDKNSLAQTVHINSIGLVPDSTVFPSGAVVFTLDDCDASQLTIAKPILDAYGFPATIFPIVDHLGSNTWTTPRLQDAQNLLGWEVGLHALTQTDHGTPFTDLTDDLLRARFDALMAWHAQWGFTRESLAWWPGGFDANAERVAREYVGWARTTSPGTQGSSISNPMRLRTQPTAIQTTTQVQAMIDAAASSKSLCIFSTFSIVASGALGSQTNQATFQAAADYAASLGIPVLTLGDAMRRLGR